MQESPPPRSVEEVKAMLESTEKGGVRNSIRNCLTVFQNDPLLSGAIAKNLLTERTDIIKPIGYNRTGTAITDTDMNYLLLYLEETYGLTSEKKIAAAIGIVANENSYHPIRDYLNGLTWDGTERIRTCLHHFLGADSDQYTYEALRLFLLGAIHRAFHPGCKFEVMLCLVGGQGAGKSTFFRLLAVKDEWFSDDLRKLDDDNVYRKLQGHWIIEMSEMIATANAKSIEEIKSFLSRQKEVYVGQNYLRSLFALGFQGFLILICVAIYAVLLQNVAISGDAINSIWSIVGYTVLLCFSLFKTSSVAKTLLGAH
jgi:predicted P-loop ATPase